MKTIPSINSLPKQRLSFTNEAGAIIVLSLNYMPSQRGWFFDIESGNFVLKGVRLTCSPNILNNYTNILDFGILCSSTNKIDPLYLDDFSTGRINLYLLDASEIAILEDY